MFQCRATPLFIILTPLFSFAPQAMAVGEGRFGAEIELGARHLSVFAGEADFADLQSRLSFIVYPQENESLADRDRNKSYLPLLSQATKDLPLMMTNFLESISPTLRQQLIADLGEPPSLQAGLVPMDKEREKAFAQMQGAKALILPPNDSLQPRANPGLHAQTKIIGAHSSKIIVNDRGTEVADYSRYWSRVNERWNKLSAEERLQQLTTWTSLPASSRAALLVYLYTRMTDKFYAPEFKGFKPDVLDLKFHQEQIAEIYSRFYPSRDALGIVEYHTLKPTERNSFFEELNRFLKFTGAQRRVMFPAQAARQDVGLHIHFSSPRFKEFDMEKFVTAYKVMMVYRALKKGDLSVLVHNPALEAQDYTFSANPRAKDLMALRYSDRVEMRYFSENVEEEMSELERTSEMSFAEAMDYVKTETSKVIEDAMIHVVLKSKDRADVRALLSFELWEKVQLSPATRVALAEFFNRSPSILVTMVQSALGQGLKISSSQLGLIEEVISTALRNPVSTRTRESYFVNIFKLVELGLIFENQLRGYSARDRFDSAHDAFVNKMLGDNLDAYAAQVEKALEAMKKTKGGRLQDHIQPRQLLTFELMFFSGRNPALQNALLEFLRNPHNQEKLIKSQILPLFLAALSEHTHNFPRKYYETLVAVLKNPPPLLGKIMCSRAVFP